jgi:hypothetical protein
MSSVYQLYCSILLLLFLCTCSHPQKAAIIKLEDNYNAIPDIRSLAWSAYFERNVVLLPKGDISPLGFDHMMSSKDLVNIMKTFAADSDNDRNFRILHHGEKWRVAKRVHRDGQYLTSSLNVNNMTFGALVRAVGLGYSIIVNKIQLSYEKAAVIASRVKRMLPIVGYNININLYLSPGGNQGFEYHFDWMDSFVIQVEGCKIWRIYSPNTHSYARRIDMRALSANDVGVLASEEISLVEGSLLYLPRGTIHEASANCSLGLGLGLEEGSKQHSLSSIHLTIGLEVDGFCSIKDYFLKIINNTMVYSPADPTHGVITRFLLFAIEKTDQGNLIWRHSMLSFFNQHNLPPHYKSCLESIDHFGFELFRLNERYQYSEYCYDSESNYYYDIHDIQYVSDCLIFAVQSALNSSSVKLFLHNNTSNTNNSINSTYNINYNIDYLTMYESFKTAVEYSNDIKISNYDITLIDINEILTRTISSVFSSPFITRYRPVVISSWVDILLFN